MAHAVNAPSQQLSPQPSDYAITITDCNSMSDAEITLRHGALNIKYGPNGIGKSTIANALALNAQGGEALQTLLPFKYRQGASGNAPLVVGADDIKKVLVFDERYVSQFVFQPDEVVKNSFEIFINTPDYQAGVAELEAIFEDLKNVFLQNEALDEVIAGLTELCNAFTLTKTGGIAKNSRGFKALGVGESSPRSRSHSQASRCFFAATTRLVGSRGNRRVRTTSAFRTTAPSVRSRKWTSTPPCKCLRSTNLPPSRT